MFSDKKLNDVAKSVAQVMENQVKEELKGNQHKIDANKNNKVDAHDFKLLRAGKKVAKEETEQVEEGIEDKLEAARAKAKAAGKPIKGPAKAEKSNVTKVAGKAYGGSAQKDEPEDDEDDTPKKATKKGVFKRRYNTKVYKEQFSHLLDSYVNGGLKGIMENLEVVEIEEDQITEEASNDEYKSELSDAQAKSEGKKKADVAAASTQAVTKEDVEQVDEISKSTYVGAMQTLSDPDGERGRHDTSDKLISRAKKQHGEKFAKDLEGVHKSHWGRPNRASGRDTLQFSPSVRTTKSGKANKQDVKTKSKEIQSRLGTHKKPNLPEQVEERTLTSSEMETREKNVKGMKKNLAGFKERYGDRAKEVLYATATRMAKKEQ